MTTQGRTALLAALALVGAACSDGNPSSPTGPSVDAALSRRIETAHFVFVHAPGDTVDPDWQEAYHAWATATLGVSPAQRLRYNKYQSRAHMQQVIGIGNTNAWADGPAQTAHTIWPTDNHEVIHLYTHAWGQPVALFSEGTAVAHQMDPVRGDLVARWSTTPIHTLARQYRAQGRLPSLADMVATDAFRRLDSGMSYPVAGSFVRFLIDTRGMDPLRILFGRLTATSPATAVREQVQAVYGDTLDALEREWHAFLDAR